MSKYFIYIQPAASKTEYISEIAVDPSKYGLPGEDLITAMKIKVAAAPVDGAANKALIKFLAKYFSKTQAEISISKGEKSRYKIVELS